MRRGDRVFRRPPAALDRERRREALVVRLDRDGEPAPEGIDELVGRPGLLPVLAAQRERHPDDHELRVVLGDERLEPLEPGAGRGALDDTDGAGERAGLVRDGDAGPRRAEVERNDLHRYSAARISRSASASASGSRSASLPPARAMVGRPPPPPPTSDAAPLTTS